MTDLPDDYFAFCIGARSMCAVDRRFPSVIHVIADLEGRVDVDRLRQAWALLPARHPLLTATIHPFRDRLFAPGTATPLAFREAVEADGAADPGPEEAALLGEHLDLRSGPPARLALIRRSRTRRLIVSVHHGLCDARAVVNLCDDLRLAYLRLAASASHTPAVDATPRHLGAVLREIGFPPDVQKRLIRKQRRLERRLPRSRHAAPMSRRRAQREAGAPTYRAIHLEATLIERLRATRLARGWTLNDVLQGLLERAWTRAIGPPRGASLWLVAADQRPRLGWQRGFGPLSGLELIWLTLADSDPEAAVQAACAIMSERKADWPGLGTVLSAYSLERLMGPRVQTAAIRAVLRLFLPAKRIFRIFTNLGALGDHLADWGDAQAARVYCVAPIPCPGFTIFTGSGFAGRATLVIGYTPPWLSADQLEELERSLREDLERLVSLDT